MATLFVVKSAIIAPASSSENGSRRRSQVALIGAGPGGLAAAMLLAAAGISVTIYEAQPVVGGRSRRIDVGPFRFDCGPTFFMMPHVLEEIFAACRMRLGDFAALTRLDPMYRLILGRPGADPITLDTTQDLARMRDRISEIDPHDGPAFERFMRTTRVKLEKLTPVLRRPIRSLMDLMTPDSMAAASVLRPWQSLHQHLAGLFRHPQVRLALSFQSKYLGMNPYECPELFSILPFIEYEYGIWHPSGGCNALMRAMADACRAMDVDIRCGEAVEAIEFTGRRACGVRVGGALHPHDHVIVNADATWALKKLVPSSLRAAARGAPACDDETIDARRYSCSTYMLHLGVEGRVDLPHHTIYTSASYRENLDDISTHGRLSSDPSMYVCNASITDPTLAPPGRSALYLLVPVPNCKPGFSKVDWAREAPVLRERALDQVERVFRVTDIRSRVVAEHQMTPEDWRGENINHGATFNLAHTYGQMLHRRPHHRLSGFDGLWLVGGGTHPGSGLPVIFLSSGITTKLLCAELGVTHPFDRDPFDPSPAAAAPAASRYAAARGATPVSSAP